MPTNFPRRQFLRTSVLTTAAAATASHTHAVPRQKLALGYDNFAVRAMGWKAPQLIDYTVELKVDTLFITDLDAFESLEENALTEIGKLAEEKGIQLYLGTWSICPTSVTFKDKWGTADEHLQIGIRAAEALKSPSLRVVLGNGKDRLSEGGIDARIDDTVAVLQRNKSIAVDAGIKIGMENHAGDMHSLELVRLIEDAGTDFVGANVDSGNAVWTLEDPVENLRNLAPYALTTSLRDTAIWESENGFTAQWTAMGEGTTDLKTYFELFASECPDVPV
ncbi:MAG: sugar phosphate isomerase/epimerase, partial [Verrucomicrobiota bacterium]